MFAVFNSVNGDESLRLALILGNTFMTNIKQELLAHLPPPPKGKKGWPWTEGSPILPDTRPDGTLWPQISIVTPSYNQGQFLEETIRSVILQNYPNLQYTIIDGGSTDESVDIIRKYEPWLSTWLSEKDEGQSHAINKGFARSTGSILAWINSDDVYCNGTLQVVASGLQNISPGWLIGATVMVNKKGKVLMRCDPLPVTSETFLSWSHRYIWQPSIFWNRKMHEKSGGEVNKDLHYIMDFDLWFRMVQFAEPNLTRQILARYRIHNMAKSVESCDNFSEEMVTWFFDKISKGDKGEKLFKQFALQCIQSQKQLERISDHRVVGRIILLWKKHINKRFDVLDKCRKFLVNEYYSNTKVNK